MTEFTFISDIFDPKNALSNQNLDFWLGFLAYAKKLPSPKGMNILTLIVEEVNILQIKDLWMARHSLNNLFLKNSSVLVPLCLCLYHRCNFFSKYTLLTET